MQRIVLSSAATLLILFSASLHADEFRIDSIDRDIGNIEERNELVKNHLSVTDYRRRGTKIIRSESDFHMVTDVSLDDLIATMTDRERQAEILPRVQEYTWQPAPNGEENVIIETQLVGIQFMGVDATYHLRQRSEMIDRREGQPREVQIRYEMLNSLDGKLESSAGAFLIQEIEWEGQKATYIRQKNVTEIRDTFLGMQGIIRLFATRDSKKLFEAMIEDARRRG